MQKAARDGGHHILSTALQNSHIYTICYPFQLLAIAAATFSQQRLMTDTALSLFFPTPFIPLYATFLYLQFAQD